MGAADAVGPPGDASRGREIARHELVDDLVRHAAVPLLVLRAPAGFGKTTLVRQWLARDPRRSAWLTIDRDGCAGDRLAEALDRALAESGVLERTHRQDTPLDERLPQAAAPFVLVVDDAHRVDPPAGALLSRVTDVLPRGSQLVLVGRSVPPVHLARRLLAGQAFEIGRSDLTLRGEEIRSLLTGHLPELSPETVELLAARCEGWPAGAGLAALALAGRDDPGPAAPDLVANDPRMAGYVHEEVLGGLTPELRAFATTTAVLGRTDEATARRALDDPGAAARLAALAAAGAVTTAGDEYRFHPMVADALRVDLGRSDPSAVAEIRRRAAHALADEGEADGAVAQALASGDLDLASALVYRFFFPALEAGEVAAVERWLDGFPPERLRADPALLLPRGWVALFAGDEAGLVDVVEATDALPLEGAADDRALDVRTGLLALEMMSGRGGARRTSEVAEQILARGPGGSPWWALALLLRTVSHQVLGRLPDHVAAFDRVERATRGTSGVHVVAMAHCGLARLRAGDDAGHAYVEAAVAEMEDRGLDAELSIVSMVRCAQSFDAALRGDRPTSCQARQHADSMLVALGDTISRGVLHHRLLLAESDLLRGDHSTAQVDLARALPLLALEPDAVVLHDWAAQLRERLEAWEDGERRSTWSQLSTAELRVLEELRSHRSLEEIGHHLFVSRNTVKSHTISIYRKLGVSGRSAAVERAVELGLLPHVATWPSATSPTER